jgi:hypothetical protein
LDDEQEDQGESIAYFIRRELAKAKGLGVMDSQSTRRIIEGEEITQETIDDPDLMIDICGELRADAVIAGTYKLYDTSEPRRYYVDRYVPNIRQYVTEPVTYYEKTHHLTMRLRIIDAQTGKPFFEEDYEPSYSEAHNIGSLIVSEVTDSKPELQRLTRGVVSQFVKKIAPHYRREQRILVK